MVRELLTQYQPSYIQQKIDLLHWKQSSSRRGKDIKDSAAWLVKAIKEDYLPPPEFEKALARKQLKETKSLLAKELGQRIAVFDKEKNAQEKERQEDHIETLKDQYRTTKKERDLWQKALGVLATTTDKATYQLWLAHTTLLTLQDDVVTLYVTNNVVKQRIESHLATNISQAVNTVLGSSINYKVTAIT